MLARLLHEVRQVGLVTLYFLFCFGVVLTLKKLMLSEYEVEVAALSGAIIGALIVGKIVVIMDKTHAGTRFDARFPLGLAVAYKTLMYVAVTGVVLTAERVFHAYREMGALGSAFATVWVNRNRAEILVKLICIGLAFLGYHLFVGIDRRLGEGTLWQMVVARRRERAEARARDARD